MINEKEIKRQIRYLRKLKKETKVKTPLRRELNKKIRALKKQIPYLYNIPPEKAKLIQEIYRIRPELRNIRFDLRKFSIEQLKHHIKLTKKKRGLK